MTRVLVLGGEGMLGHRLVAEFRKLDLEVVAATRGDGRRLRSTKIIEDHSIIRGFEARSFESIFAVVNNVRPHAVVNAVGVIKQRSEAAHSQTLIEINALFPQRLLHVCEAFGARLVQVSTDCVFSGTRGSYSEDSTPDAGDAYGQTKHLGEVRGKGALTLRTSIIGRELSGCAGLVEWFLAQRGTAPGFSRARFSGLTTGAFARIVAKVLGEFPELTGLYHVAAEPIDKRTLLTEIGRRLRPTTTIEPMDDPVIDRTLDGSRFVSATGLRTPSWGEMLDELQAGSRNYDVWRTQE